MPAGLTLAPAGTATSLLDLRSTAGSCLGRFIGLSRCWRIQTMMSRKQEWEGCPGQPSQTDHRADARIGTAVLMRLPQSNEGRTPPAPAGTAAVLV